MQTETQKTLELPGFLYRGFDVPRMNLQAHLYDNLGTSMEAQQIAPLSVPYAWKIGLYLVGRDLSWNEPDVHRLPPVVKEAGRLVYEDCQARLDRGAWHKDGVLYLHNNETPKGRRQPKKGHVLAKYFMGIEKFEEVDGIWRPKPDLETQEFLIDLPTGEWWFVIPPEEGEVYTPAGTPKNTTKNREEALRAWMDTGLTEEQAKNELSRFHRRSSGTSAVYSWSNDYGGPLCLFLSYGPGLRVGGRIGSFAASIVPSGARPVQKNSGYDVVETETYLDLQRAKNKLLEMKKQLRRMSK